MIRYRNLDFFENIITEIITDENASFGTSTIFSKYYNTNRYQGDVINTNTKINYNLNGI
jgi:hypothetical protein